MYKIITFSYYSPDLFKKYNCPFSHNEEIEVPDNIAIDTALAQAKVVLESGLNVMIKNISDRKIIWVAVSDGNFSQR